MIDHLLTALFKKVEALYVVPGTFDSPSVPTRGRSFLFRMICHQIQKIRSHLILNTLKPMPRMLCEVQENGYALLTRSRLLTHLGVLTNCEPH